MRSIVVLMPGRGAKVGRMSILQTGSAPAPEGQNAGPRGAVLATTIPGVLPEVDPSHRLSPGEPEDLGYGVASAERSREQEG